MSKKLDISIPNKVRPNLVELFHQYLKNRPKYKSNQYDWDDMDEYELEYLRTMFPGWDDDLPFDDGVFIYPDVSSSSSHNNRKRYSSRSFDQLSREDSFVKRGKRKHSKGKKGKKDIEIPFKWDELTDGVDDGDLKEIWFYADYHDKEDRLEFNSVDDFLSYCTSMGYYVSNDVISDLKWRYESHCCLSRESQEEYGLFEVVTEHSYGELFYEVCEASELGN